MNPKDEELQAIFGRIQKMVGGVFCNLEKKNPYAVKLSPERRNALLLALADLQELVDAEVLLNDIPANEMLISEQEPDLSWLGALLDTEAPERLTGSSSECVVEYLLRRIEQKTGKTDFIMQLRAEINEARREFLIWRKFKEGLCPNVEKR